MGTAVQNCLFPSNDIRRFVTTRVVNSANKLGPNVEMEHPAFVTDRVSSQGERVDGEGEVGEVGDSNEVFAAQVDDKVDEKVEECVVVQPPTTPPSGDKEN